jgi:uncharacterized protein (TIGR02300 family)
MGPVDALLTAAPRRAKGNPLSKNRPKGSRSVAKPELGTKRLCAGCSAKFYDLNKTPPVCPKCGTVFEVAPVSTRPRPDQAARAAAARTAAAEAVEPREAELISLEDADAEAQGKKKVVATADADADGVEGVDTDDAIEEGEDDTFIEETEEEDTDVTEIIGGDLPDEEET